MSNKSANAIRCESCGAALDPGKATCDYCGSHHNLPAYQPGTLTDPPAPAALVSPRRLLVLLVVAAASAAIAWLLHS